MKRSRYLPLVISVIILALILSQAADSPPSSFRVYFVGNSVTDTVRYPQLAALADGRGIKMSWGRHMIPGAPLEWLYTHPNEGFREDPFGGWSQALNQFSWDAVSLQPFDRHLHAKDKTGEDLGDVVLISKLARLAAAQNPNVRIYVYARWPRVTIGGKGVPFDKNDYDPARPGSGNDLSKVDDFTARWEAKYTGGWDNTNETRDYFETLLREVRAETPFLRNRGQHPAPPPALRTDGPRLLLPPPAQVRKAQLPLHHRPTARQLCPDPQ